MIRSIVAAPRRVAPRSYGLFSAAQFPVETDTHWEGGVTWQGGPCASTSTWSGDCGPGDPKAQAPTALFGATPYVIQGSVDCGPVGTSQADMELRLAEWFLYNEEFNAERTLWTGITDSGGVAYPHLASTVTVLDPADTTILLQSTTPIIAGGPYDIVEGVGRIEDTIAECEHNDGVIHVPQILAAHMAAWDLLEPRGNRMFTPGGMAVIIGKGYPGSSPAGVTSTTSAWIYGTGPVALRQSPLRITSTYGESIDKTTNDTFLVMERTNVQQFDCCLVAVEISTGGVITGTGGIAT